MAAAIAEFPTGRYVGHGVHDAFGDFDAIPLKVVVDVDAAEGRVEIDLRRNPDCIPAGLNLSQATAVATTITGLLIALGADVPPNSGTFRRISVRLRENCIVGIPVHPTSCSCATTNLAARLQNLTQSLLAAGGEAFGSAEVGPSLGLGLAVISGHDMRPDSAYYGKPYVNQLIVGNNGGGATPESDGWLTYQNPPNAALLYRDSVEVLEQKYPLAVQSLRLVPDSGGPGRFRGAPTVEVVYGPVAAPMSLAWCGDGYETPPAGIHGGHPGSRSGAVKIAADGSRELLPSMGHMVLEVGELVAAVENGGGGCGDPLERDRDAVLLDVLEGWVSEQSALETYGVVLTGAIEDESLAIDQEATRVRRASPAEEAQPCPPT
jgi:N-methylhydantoinase B